MKKFLSLILCALLSLGVFCSCDDGEDVAMEDLEYGATMRQLKDMEIDICFDGRFFTDEEMRAVNNYFYSIQTKNLDLFLSVQSEDYTDYCKITADSDYTEEDFLNLEYEANASVLGENFEYTYIEAVECGDRTDDLQIDTITELMDSIYEENGKDTTFKETIKSAKYAVLDMMADSNGESYTYDDQRIYIFTCTDGIYLFV